LKGEIMYLVYFEYTGWCQGPDDTYAYLLVKNVSSFKEACEKIKEQPEYESARDFKNLTIE